MDDFNEAVGMGLRLLHTRDRMPEEIRTALAAKGFSTETIESALAHLVRKGVLSEARALEGKLRGLSGKRAKGDQAITADLERMGASQEAITDALESLSSELDRAKELIAAKFHGMADPAKVARFLNARGFQEETIRSLLEDLGVEH